MSLSTSVDQSRKTPEEILSQQIQDGLEELRRPTLGLSLSALSAGLDIGFGPLLMVVLMTLVDGSLPAPVVRVLLSAMYSVGFLFVVLGRSELFTEHTTLAVLPVLDGRASLGRLGRLWGLVYLFNIVGGAIFAAFAVLVGTRLGVTDATAFGEIATTLAKHDLWTILLAGVLAGWLMGLLTWLVTAAKDTVSRVLIVTLVSGVIGFAHLPHVIAGNVEVLMGLFAGDAVTIAMYARFLVGATVGNAIGGTVFVGLLKYGHAVRNTDEVPSDVDPGAASED